MPFQNDADWELIDRVIALADDAYRLADRIIEITEDPDVINIARRIQEKNLQIEKRTRDYKSRLKDLKECAKTSSGSPISGKNGIEPSKQKTTPRP